MFAVLLCTVVGFFIGLAYVMKKQKISVGSLLATTVVGLVLAGIAKVLKESQKRRRF